MATVNKHKILLWLQYINNMCCYGYHGVQATDSHELWDIVTTTSCNLHADYLGQMTTSTQGQGHSDNINKMADRWQWKHAELRIKF